MNQEPDQPQTPLQQAKPIPPSSGRLKVLQSMDLPDLQLSPAQPLQTPSPSVQYQPPQIPLVLRLPETPNILGVTTEMPEMSRGAESSEAGVAPPITATQIRKFQRFLEYPGGQRAVEFFSDSQVRLTLNHLHYHPHLQQLFYAEIGLVVFFFALRTWLVFHANAWFRKLWIKIWTFAVFLILFVFIIPIIGLWKDYYDLLNQIIHFL